MAKRDAADQQRIDEAVKYLVDRGLTAEEFREAWDANEVGKSLPPKQLGILQHAIGYRKPTDKPCRNYFCTYPTCDYHADCEALERLGLMIRRKADPEIYGDAIYFHATRKGRLAALLMPIVNA